MNKNKIISFLIFILGIFVFLSLISYSANDPSFSVVASDTYHLNNFFGVFGSYTADIFIQFFGMSSFTLVLFGFVLSFLLMFDKLSNNSWINIYRVFLFLVFFMASSIFFQSFQEKVSYAGTKIYTAGFFSDYISKILFLNITRLGTATIFFLLSFFSFFMMIDVSIKKVFFYTFLFFYYLFLYIGKGFKYFYLFIKRINKIFFKDEEIILEKSSKRKAKKPNKINENLEAKPQTHRAELPTLDLLNNPPSKGVIRDTKEFSDIAVVLESSLKDFGVEGKITDISQGPVITMFEYKPAPGVKITKVSNLSDDLALALGTQSVRIIAPIPGKKSIIGIEVPNTIRETVFLKELVSAKSFRNTDKILPLALGKDIEGNPYFSDLSKMPHLLVAGSTGSGKSVFINTLLCSFLFKFSSHELKFIMVDPKMLELSSYANIPHLLLPVVTEPGKASLALKWAVKEMIRRYELLSALGARSIETYNKKAKEKLPYIVIVIDELADLMMVCSKEVETSITRLAQMARASGIHLVLATQRPSVDVITGLIKANFPSRIAFRVSSRIDARTIMDTQGAEKLLGNGDMLFMGSGSYAPIRIHGAYVSDDEVKNVVDFVRKQGPPAYKTEILEAEEEIEARNNEFDPLYDEALKIVLQNKKASISFLQRKLKIGYNRAASIIETMEAEGIVSSQSTAGSRRVIER